mgnify:CR=1 FL=1|tara:strand:+ start:77819 stop:79072 length:1254 start_codon:yes stop_codon:yes gene_type:complete
MEGVTSSHLYRNVIKTVETAGQIVDLNGNALRRLETPRRAITVSVPCRMDDGTVQIFAGYRVQHNQTLGPFKGGLRYHPSVNLSEVAALAALMTYKNSLLGLPLGGAKGGITVDQNSLSKAELENLTRNFTTELVPFIGPDKDIPAPDVGTSAQTMAWMLDTYSKESGYCQTGVVTGKPIEIGGSMGREAATGLGVVFCTMSALEALGRELKDSTIAIQGFGKVGMHAAIEAHKLGAKIVAVSDVSGGIYNPEGLNVPELVEYVEDNKVVNGYPSAKDITNEELLELKVDVLAPCALDGVITSDNADDIQADIIIEGANGPVTNNASEILFKKKKLVVPDILANGGGVIVSYFEWVQDIVWLFWTEEEVRSKLKSVMDPAFKKVWEFSQKEGQDMRTSAMAVSLKRLEQAMKLRGLL